MTKVTQAFQPLGVLGIDVRHRRNLDRAEWSASLPWSRAPALLPFIFSVGGGFDSRAPDGSFGSKSRSPLAINCAQKAGVFRLCCKIPIINLSEFVRGFAIMKAERLFSCRITWMQLIRALLAILIWKRANA